MMFPKRVIYILMTCLCTSISAAQVNISDSSIGMHIITARYEALSTGSDLADRYGFTNGLGLSYSYKFESNFFFGAGYNMLFGGTVRERDILKNISTREGYLIDEQGLMTPVATEMAGFQTEIFAGKVFPVAGPNPNSGLYLSLGTGIIQHRIMFSYSNTYVPQIEGAYRKGYDRLCNGVSLSETIGFLHLGNRNMGNFHIALQFTQGFTRSRRDWDIDKMAPDNNKRLDLLNGLNIGWDLPVYRKAPPEFYFY